MAGIVQVDSANKLSLIQHALVIAENENQLAAQAQTIFDEALGTWHGQAGNAFQHYGEQHSQLHAQYNKDLLTTHEIAQHNLTSHTSADEGNAAAVHAATT